MPELPEIEVTTELTYMLSALIARIADKLAELDRLSEVDASHTLGEPASTEEIEAFGARAGWKLPEDYKAFLQLHNGWQNFNGENSLLSIEEMTDGPIHEHIASFQEDLRSGGLDDVGSGLVFEASFGTRISYFDRVGLSAMGQLQIVFRNRRPLQRYDSFMDYLADYEKMLDKFIADERGGGALTR
jgi:SMI1 / KNR4 family (SUKH-1)